MKRAAPVKFPATPPMPLLRPRAELVDENEQLKDEVLRLSLRLAEADKLLAASEERCRGLQRELALPENAHLALARQVADTFRTSYKTAEKRLARIDKVLAEANLLRERAQATVAYQAGLLAQVADALDVDDWDTLPARARELAK